MGAAQALAGAGDYRDAAFIQLAGQWFSSGWSLSLVWLWWRQVSKGHRTLRDPRSFVASASGIKMTPDTLIASAPGITMTPDTLIASAPGITMTPDTSSLRPQESR